MQKRMSCTSLPLALLLLLVSLARAQQPAPTEAIAGIVGAFDRYPVVAIAEAPHGLQQAGTFYEALVRDRRFNSKVNELVVEFGSRRSQPVVDRYVTGRDVPIAEL